MKQMEKREPEVSPEVSKLMEEVTLAKKELMIREESLREREDSVMVMQHSLHEGARNLVGTVVEQAEQRHTEVMENQQQQHRSQLEQMHNQLIWLTALAGESRVTEVMSDPQKSEEVMQQAMLLRERLISGEEAQGAQTEGPMRG